MTDESTRNAHSNWLLVCYKQKQLTQTDIYINTTRWYKSKAEANTPTPANINKKTTHVDDCMESLTTSYFIHSAIPLPVLINTPSSPSPCLDHCHISPPSSQYQNSHSKKHGQHDKGKDAPKGRSVGSSCRGSTSSIITTRRRHGRWCHCRW